METNPTRPGPSLADDNQDIDPKSGSQDPHKGDPMRGGVVKPRPLSAEPPEERIEPDTGSKTDRVGEVDPKERS